MERYSNIPISTLASSPKLRLAQIEMELRNLAEDNFAQFDVEGEYPDSQEDFGGESLEDKLNEEHRKEPWRLRDEHFHPNMDWSYDRGYMGAPAEDDRGTAPGVPL